MQNLFVREDAAMASSVSLVEAFATAEKCFRLVAPLKRTQGKEVFGDGKTG